MIFLVWSAPGRCVIGGYEVKTVWGGVFRGLSEDGKGNRAQGGGIRRVLGDKEVVVSREALAVQRRVRVPCVRVQTLAFTHSSLIETPGYSDAFVCPAFALRLHHVHTFLKLTPLGPWCASVNFVEKRIGSDQWKENRLGVEKRIGGDQRRRYCPSRRWSHPARSRRWTCRVCAARARRRTPSA